MSKKITISFYQSGEIPEIIFETREKADNFDTILKNTIGDSEFGEYFIDRVSWVDRSEIEDDIESCMDETYPDEFLNYVENLEMFYYDQCFGGRFDCYIGIFNYLIKKLC